MDVVAARDDVPRASEAASWEDVFGLQRAPNLGEPSRPFGRWVGRDGGGIEGADRGGDESVRDDACFDQRLELPDLSSAQDASAGEYERDGGFATRSRAVRCSASN